MLGTRAVVVLFLVILLFSPSLAHISPSPSPSSSSLSPFLPPLHAVSPPSPILQLHLSPSPSLSVSTSAPAPSPNHQVEKATASDVMNTVDDEENDGRMSGGKKAGIAFGVIVAMAVLGLGAFVYKKRQENIARARYAGYNARMMEMV